MKSKSNSLFLVLNKLHAWWIFLIKMFYTHYDFNYKVAEF